MFNVNVALRDADRNMVNKDFCNAYALWTKIYEVSQDTRFLIQAGICKLELQKLEEALELFERAECLGNEKALIWSGVTLRRLHRYTDAIACFQKVLSSSTQVPASVYTELGGCFEAQRRYDDAITSYLSARTQVPSNPYLCNRLAICYEQAGLTDRLRELLREDAYWESLKNAEALGNTLEWYLRLKEPLNIQVLLAALKGVSLLGNFQLLFDVLTIFVGSRITDSIPGSSDIISFFEAHPYGISALRTLRAFPISHLQEELRSREFLTDEAAAEAISERLLMGEPFCLIRLGDGEGNFIGPTMDCDNPFLIQQRSLIVRNWFGHAGRTASFDRLEHDFVAAVNEADFLGVPNIERLRYEQNNDARGFWGVYFSTLFGLRSPGRHALISPVLHLKLFAFESFVRALVRCQHVNTISCHPEFGTLLRQRLGLSSGLDFVVPGEMGITKLPEGSRRGEHYPSVYKLAGNWINQLRPRQVTLVAAGICGKVYAQLCKRGGGYGIDIGALADFMMGYETRKGFAAVSGIESFRFDRRV